MSVLAAEVRRLVAEACAVDPDTVACDTRLAGLGLDSVRAVDLMVALEERFGAEVSEQEAVRLTTVAELVALVERKRTR